LPRYRVLWSAGAGIWLSRGQGEVREAVGSSPLLACRVGLFAA